MHLIGLLILLVAAIIGATMHALPEDNPRTNYTIEFYARAALRWLRAKKGIVRLLNRVPENERNAAFEKGDVIKLRRPSTFTAQSHVGGTGTSVQGLHAQNVQIPLDQEYEVKFGVTDRQLATAGQKLVDEHIGPAVDALVEKIESTVYALGHYIGPKVLATAAAAEDIIVPARKVLLDNRTPMDPNNLFCAVDPSLAAIFLADPIFHQAQVVGQGNQQALVDAMLGRRFGINFFESQLALRAIAQEAETLALAAATGDEVGAIDSGVAGGYAVNTTVITVDALTDAETIAVTNDTLKIAGDPTVYRITAVSGAVTGNQVDVTIFPGLQRPAAENAVVTFENRLAIQDAAGGTVENLMFHRDAMTIVMAPLPEYGAGVGVNSYTATDEETGLSIRVREFADGHKKERYVAVDALWGVQVLNPQLAVRMLRAG